MSGKDDCMLPKNVDCPPPDTSPYSRYLEKMQKYLIHSTKGSILHYNDNEEWNCQFPAGLPDLLMCPFLHLLSRYCPNQDNADLLPVRLYHKPR